MPFKRFLFAAFAASSLFATACEAGAATISSQAPGNIFVEKQPLRFSLQNARGNVSLSLREYSRREVWSGNGTQSVSIPPQPPGWYELSARDESGTTTVSLGVVMNRNNAPLPKHGRVAGDAAIGWLITNEAQRVPFARMVKLAGIPWVRERLSWTENEPAPGKLAWTQRYEDTAAAYAGEGVHVLQMWHDTPTWTRPGREKTSLAPDDLRDIYRFTRALASHYAGFSAWEAWNEADLHFWPELSDRFAGLQKAAYFGFKDGNSRVPVTYGGFALPERAFVRGFFANGGGDYADFYNWHRYAEPPMYPADLATHRAAAKENGATAKEWWLTEAGVPLPGTEGEDKLVLSEDNQRKQARFVPRNVAMSLVAGNAKHFFFVLPSYSENGTQFGSLKPDLTPYPSFVALSAAANILGVSDYAGQVLALPASVTAQAFDTNNGRVVAAWSETPQTISLPARRGVTVYDMFGRASTRVPQNGRVAIEIGPDAIYLRGANPQIAPPAADTMPVPITRKVAPRVLATTRRAAPSRVVILGFADLPLDKTRDAYLLGTRTKIGADGVATVESIALDTPVSYTVQVYNFDEKVSHSGTIAPQAPRGWRVSPAKHSVKLAPMERRVLAFTLVPPTQSEVMNRVRVSGTFAGQRVSPAVSSFALDPAGIAPASRRRLDWLLPSLWDANGTSAAGRTLISRTPVGTLRLDSVFDKPGDRWAYPRQTFATPQNYADFDGIAFDLKVEKSVPGSLVRLMLTEEGGAVYMSGGASGDLGARRVVVLFRDMEWGSHGARDANNKLDLDKIVSVQLGFNTPGDAMSFEAENFELVKFAAKLDAK